MQTLRFNDMPVMVGTIERAVREIVDSPNGPNTYRLINSGTLYAASLDQRYWDLLVTSGVNLPDGKPLARWMRHKYRGSRVISEQVRGPTLMLEVLSDRKGRQLRHFFYGSTPNTLAALDQMLRRTSPDLQIVGTHSPPFSDSPLDDDKHIHELVIAARPDIVWVGLGTPKQDFVAQRLHDEYQCTTIAVGAAFDFAAGTKRAAPLWMREAYLEWAYRLAREPGRLGRRYILGNLRFIRLVVRDWLS